MFVSDRAARCDTMVELIRLHGSQGRGVVRRLELNHHQPRADRGS